MIERFWFGVQRLRELGVRDGSMRLLGLMRDTLHPPRTVIFWLPLRGFSAPSAPADIRVVTVWGRSSDSPPTRDDVINSGIGSDEESTFVARLAVGANCHLLFVNDKLAARLYTVSGMTHPFQHVPLTRQDAMVVDARVVPAFRGRGLYKILLTETARSLANAEIDRLYIDTSDRNTASLAALRRVGFVAIVGYRTRGKRYLYDVSPL